jgi:hypothetical protein
MDAHTAIASNRSRSPEHEWLSRKEAAAYLSRRGYPISAGGLTNLAANNNKRKGPPFIRARWNLSQYRRADLDAWLQSKMVTIA